MSEEFPASPPPPPPSLWREGYPELSEILEQDIRPAVDAYGETYLNNIDRAYHEYGLEGVETQLLYIANNLHHGKDLERRTLLAWMKRIRRDRQQPPPVALTSCSICGELIERERLEANETEELCGSCERAHGLD